MKVCGFNIYTFIMHTPLVPQAENVELAAPNCHTSASLSAPQAYIGGYRLLFTRVT